MLCFLVPQVNEGPASLRVVAVVRKGLPPYEENDRLYRVEGKGCALLKVEETLILRRMGEKRSPGKLRVMEAHWDHALACLLEGGETYPLIDDLALRIDPPEPLPPMPASAPMQTSIAAAAMEVRIPLREEPKVLPLPAPVPIQAKVIPEIPAPEPPAQVPVREKRQPIYFIKGDASLSPGALRKLKTYRESWNANVAWTLVCPGSPGLSLAVQHDRIAALREELGRLGIEWVEVRFTPAEAPGKYDVIYVMCELK